jgi:hypothetical protein
MGTLEGAVVRGAIILIYGPFIQIMVGLFL